MKRFKTLLLFLKDIWVERATLSAPIGGIKAFSLISEDFL